MIKYVYAVISSEKDYIVEQSLVSMYSLKLHNPEAKIVLVTDKETYGTLHDERGRIKAYVDEVVIENPPEYFTATEKSRFLKTSLRRVIRGDFFYLDNDTIITGSLKELENFPGEMGAVKDHHRDAVAKSSIIHGQLVNYLIKTKKKFWGYPVYYNGGIFLARDTKSTIKFFEDWHNLWMEEREKYGIEIDQPSFAQANHHNNYMVKELRGEYNIQLIFTKEALHYLGKSKVVHYFNNADRSKYFPLNMHETLETIRHKGIYGEIEELISFPLKAHLEDSIILTGDEKDNYNTPLVILARIMGVKHKRLQDFARLLFKVRRLPLD